MDKSLKRDVVRDIVRRYQQGLPLSAYRLQRGIHTEPRLYRLACRAFGTWNLALKSAIACEPGIWTVLPGKVLGQILSRAEIVARIRRRFEEGLPMNRGDIVAGPQADYALYSLGLCKLGSWTNALRAAGILSKHEQRYRKHSYPREADVVAEIKRRHASGLPIVYRGVARKPYRDTALLATAKKKFGSWHSAVAAAGFSIPTLTTIRERIRRYCQACNVLAEIRRRHREKLSLYYQDVEHRFPGDASLLKAAKRIFGSWKAAVRASGLSYAKVCPRHRSRRYPDALAVLAAIQARHKTGRPLSCRIMQHTDSALYRQAVTLFGSWRQAIEKAGIDYASVILLVGFPSRYPTAESVIKAIRQRKSRGYPLNFAALEEGPTGDRTLIRRGKVYFGTWRVAIEAAGISYQSVCRVFLGRMPRKEIMARIRKRAAQGHAMTEIAVRNRKPRDFVLWRQARLAFGTWAKALQAAGVASLTGRGFGLRKYPPAFISLRRRRLLAARR